VLLMRRLCACVRLKGFSFCCRPADPTWRLRCSGEGQGKGEGGVCVRVCGWCGRLPTCLAAVCADGRGRQKTPRFYDPGVEPAFSGGPCPAIECGWIVVYREKKLLGLLCAALYVLFALEENAPKGWSLRAGGVCAGVAR